jgi:hypothetical protein
MAEVMLRRSLSRIWVEVADEQSWRRWISVVMIANPAASIAESRVWCRASGDSF